MFGAGFFEDLGTATGRVLEGCCWIVAAGLGVGNASYRMSDRVSVDFSLDNVTDRYYLDALSLGLIPAPGRTARLAVTLQF